MKTKWVIFLLLGWVVLTKAQTGSSTTVNPYAKHNDIRSLTQNLPVTISDSLELTQIVILDSIPSPTVCPPAHKAWIYFNGKFRIRYDTAHACADHNLDSVGASVTYPKDTVSRGFKWINPTAADSQRYWRVNQSGLTAIKITVDVQAGTSATIMMCRIRSGSKVDMLNANAVVSAISFTSDFTNATTLQNTDLQIGDIIVVVIRALSGTVTSVVVQLDCEKTK